LPYYVYILTNKSNRVLYIGMTNNIQRRIYEHKNKLLDGFSSKYNLNKLVYFESTNDVKEAKKHFDTKGIPWSNKEARKWIRKNYRNNKCEKYSYGALTGEESALLYLKAGILKKEKGDIIILYSDGFYPFLKEKFFEVILTKDKSKIDLYIENKIKQNKKIYGEEKTILILEID